MIFGFDFVFRQIDDGVVLFDFDEHFFAVLTDLIIGNVTDDRFLSLLQAVTAQVPRFFAIGPVVIVVVAFIITDSPALIEDPVINQAKVFVIPRRNGETNDSILDAIGIDLHAHRRLYLA